MGWGDGVRMGCVRDGVTIICARVCMCVCVYVCVYVCVEECAGCVYGMHGSMHHHCGRGGLHVLVALC